MSDDDDELSVDESTTESSTEQMINSICLSVRGSVNLSMEKTN